MPQEQKNTLLERTVQGRELSCALLKEQCRCVHMCVCVLSVGVCGWGWVCGGGCVGVQVCVDVQLSQKNCRVMVSVTD